MNWYRLTEAMNAKDLKELWKPFSAFYTRKGLKLIATIQADVNNPKRTVFFIWRQVSESDAGEKYILHLGSVERLGNIQKYLTLTGKTNLWNGRGAPPPSLPGQTMGNREWMCEKLDMEAIMATPFHVPGTSEAERK